MRYKTPTGLILLAATVAWTSSSTAQTGYYYRLDAGYNDIEETDVEFRPAGSTTVIAGEYESDETAGAQIGVGYRWTSRLRGELTLSWLDETDVEGPGAIGGPPSPPPPASPTLYYATELTVLTLMGNAYLDLLPEGARFRPYVGVGAGFARLELEDTAVTGPGLSARIRGNTDNEFAWRAEIGAAIPLSPRLSLNVAYSRLDAGEAGSGTAGDGGRLLAESSRFDVEIDQVLLGLIVRLDE